MAHIKDSQSYHFSSLPPKKDHSMKLAVVVAVVSHVVLIFGISFGTGKTPADMAQDVASVLTDNIEENENAYFIANASQDGSGQSEVIERQETSQISPLEADTIQETQDILNQQKQIRQQRYQQSYLSTTLSWRESEEENDNDKDKQQDTFKEKQQRLRKEIATLEAQLSQTQQELAAKTKIETVDSNNATTFNKTSHYLDNFRQHVENVANHYYPVQALAQNITGEVRLMVIIRADGTVKAIRLLESSGSAILDEAAKQSVRQAAPFGKFKKDMKDIVELRIIRTWRYAGSGVTKVTY